MLDDYDRRITSGQVWVWHEEGEIVGFVVLEDQPDGLLLDNVAVSPSAQGKGLGRELIVFAEQEARQRGYGELRLYTHMLMVENLALYAHLGFKEIGRMQRQGYHRVYMAKRVA